MSESTLPVIRKPDVQRVVVRRVPGSDAPGHHNCRNGMDDPTDGWEKWAEYMKVIREMERKYPRPKYYYYRR